MGITIDRDSFEEHEYADFSRRLERNLEALGLLLEQPGFGVGPASIGTELEMSLVDARGEPLMLNREIRDELGDDAFTLELDRFNLEYNSAPTALAGRPFSVLAGEMRHHVQRVRDCAARYGGRVAVIGILPTLRPSHFTDGVITDLPRYRGMNAGLRRLRHQPFRVRIRGEEDLAVDASDVSLEGANTSFQIHLRVNPDQFTDTYNAAQIATPIALALAGNSPLFLQRKLWAETRIALFKQAVDDRDELAFVNHETPRVCFGRRWLERGIAQLFEESVREHAPLLPIVDDEDPVAAVRAGRLPRLLELRLHHGTVWRWNRAVYDPAAGGNVRIEFRALPAGPTVTDMMANAAFLVGLTLGLRRNVAALLPRLPFEAVHGNFYRAAQHGLETRLTWPDEGGRLAGLASQELAQELLPVAERGLVDAGVDAAEAAACLDVVRERVRTGRTGAQWQRRRLPALESAMSRRHALAQMLSEYIDLSGSDEPVHTWPERAPLPAPARPAAPSPALRRRPRPPPGEVPPDVPGFLRWLAGPSWIALPGLDSRRRRIVTTLLHGNEPSGLRAIHAYLRSNRQPAVDSVFYVASVDAALAPPGLAHRMLPGRRDLNRCFAPPFDDLEGRRAEAFLEAFRGDTFEALVDLHNSTGHSPSYGVAPGVDAARLNLTALFGDFFMDSDIRLGTLVEACGVACPAVTIECGTAGDPAADAIALAGLERFLSIPELDLDAEPARHLRVLSRSVRVTVAPDLALAYDEVPRPGMGLTLREDLDRLNFQPIPAGTCIGWSGPGGWRADAWPLQARGADGRDVAGELFQLDRDCSLRTRCEMIPVMMTTDPVVAHADCVFYAMNVKR